MCVCGSHIAKTSKRDIVVHNLIEWKLEQTFSFKTDTTLTPALVYNTALHCSSADAVQIAIREAESI
ncbi:hypothetical protein D3C73_1615270 [compost metagenome]